MMKILKIILLTFLLFLSGFDYVCAEEYTTEETWDEEQTVAVEETDGELGLEVAKNDEEVDYELYGTSSTSTSSVTGVTLGDGVIGVTSKNVDQQAVYKEALQRVIYWRKDALNDTNIKFFLQEDINGNGNYYTVRQYLAKMNMSETEYLNPKWSTALEKIAIQRAVEAGISWSHTRPNNTSCFTARVNNVGSEGEILAGGTSTIKDAINLWASEKSEYLKYLNGDKNYGETGHYTMLINPARTYYGFGGASYVWAGEAWGGVVINFGANFNTYIRTNVPDGGSNPTNLMGTYSFEVALSEDEVSNVKWTGPNTISVGSRENYTVSFKCGTQTFAAKGTWTSSDTSVATVDGNGNLTGRKKGTTTVTLNSGTKTFMQDIKVINEAVMYRMYNPNSGEHFYTANAEEKNNLVNVGWKYEGLGWIAPEASKTPVYRLYSGTDHHYTTSSKERDELVKVGWKDEGIGWYSDDSKGVPLYRQYNPNVDPTAQTNNSGSHNYTTSKEENDELVKVGWKAEGIAWYGIYK